MAGRSAKRQGARGAAPVALPSPSITLDVVTPQANGSTEQDRPTFNDFDQAIARLTYLKHVWTKTLAAHKKAARKK